MDKEALIELLVKTDAFASAPREALDLLVSAGEIKSISESDDLLTQGSTAESIWMLIEGELDVFVNGEKANHLSSAGDVVGEISAVSLIPATATVKSKREGTAFEIPQKTLHQAMESSPELASSMLRSMAKYLGRL